MLPASERTRRPSLADVMPSCLASISRRGRIRWLSPGRQGRRARSWTASGAFPLARQGRARPHARATPVEGDQDRRVGFPTTTAASLASLTTGAHARRCTDWSATRALDTGNDRVVNQLSGWDDRMDPASWQRSRTVFEQATGSRRARATSSARNASGTPASPRPCCAAPSIAAAPRSGNGSPKPRRHSRRRATRRIVYLYVAELDQAGHAFGWESTEWTRQSGDDRRARSARSPRRSDGGRVCWSPPTTG